MFLHVQEVTKTRVATRATSPAKTTNLVGALHTYARVHRPAVDCYARVNNTDDCVHGHVRA